MLTEEIDRQSARGHYNIAMVAPPWAPIAPESRDVELAISLLSTGLVRGGHRVTLFAAPGSTCSATVNEVVQPYGVREVGSAPFETDYVARVFAMLKRGAEHGRPFDILHDHCGLAVIAMADWISMPVVHTMHWSFNRKIGDMYAQYADHAHLVATTGAQAATVPNARLAGIVPDPVDLRGWPLQPNKQNSHCGAGDSSRSLAPARSSQPLGRRRYRSSCAARYGVVRSAGSTPRSRPSWTTIRSATLEKSTMTAGGN
jgi:hypothetical protein